MRMGFYLAVAGGLLGQEGRKPRRRSEVIPAPLPGLVMLTQEKFPGQATARTEGLTAQASMYAFFETATPAYRVLYQLLRNSR